MYGGVVLASMGAGDGAPINADRPRASNCGNFVAPASQTAVLVYWDASDVAP